MAANLASLGLLPAAAHPDAELFAMTTKSKARHDDWNAARGETAKRRLLAEWRKDCPVRQEELIARFVPSTLEGLVEKADAALRAWREDDAPERYKRMWATMATTLEQAIRVLQAQQVVEMPPPRELDGSPPGEAPPRLRLGRKKPR